MFHEWLVKWTDLLSDRTEGNHVRNWFVSVSVGLSSAASRVVGSGTAVFSADGTRLRESLLSESSANTAPVTEIFVHPDIWSLWTNHLQWVFQSMNLWVNESLGEQISGRMNLSMSHSNSGSDSETLSLQLFGVFLLAGMHSSKLMINVHYKMYCINNSFTSPF